MDKKEFMFDEEDFNHALLLTALKKLIVQMVDGKLEYVSKEDIAQQWWVKMSMKYLFVLSTVEQEIPGRDARFFMAVPL